MKFTFEVNQRLLAATCLFSEKGRKIENLESIKNSLWDKYRSSYELFLNRKPHLLFIEDNYKENLINSINDIDTLLDELISSQEFQLVLDETNKYKETVETSWNEKKTELLDKLNAVLRTELEQKEFKVFIIHPSLSGGMYLGENRILWGHEDEWPNYSLIYLIHEALHSYFGKSETEHAVIELISDNELRSQINHDPSDYLEDITKIVGHEHLRNIKVELLPQWQEYLGSSEDIYSFIKKIKN